MIVSPCKLWENTKNSITGFLEEFTTQLSWMSYGAFGVTHSLVTLVIIFQENKCFAENRPKDLPTNVLFLQMVLFWA